MCSSSQPSSTSSTQVSDVPDWAKPYAKEVLGQGAALTQTPYQTFQQDRQAQFTPLQKQAFTAAGNLSYDPYSTAAAQGLQGLAQKAGDYRYTPEKFGNAYTSPQAYNPSQFNAQQVNAPQLQNYQMQGPRDVQGQQATAAQLGAAPMA